MVDGSGEVNVDLGGLDDVAGSLQGGIAKGFQEGLGRAADLVADGVSIASAAPGGNMRAVAEMLAHAIDGAYNTMTGKAVAARNLGIAIRQIIANYQGADEAAVRQLTILQDALDQAEAQTQAVLQHAPRPRAGEH